MLLKRKGNEGGRQWEREVSLCVCKNNLQYETRRNATRKVRRASASACTTDSAVTPAEAATAAAAAVAVTVAYGGRLLRFSFGQRKYKEIWKIRCVILYVCIVHFYEHTRVFSVFFSLLFLFFLYLSKCVFCIQYWRRVCRLYMYLYVCMLRADRFVCYAEFSFPLSLRRPCVLLFCYYLFCVVVFDNIAHVHFLFDYLHTEKRIEHSPFAFYCINYAYITPISNVYARICRSPRKAVSKECEDKTKTTREVWT